MLVRAHLPSLARAARSLHRGPQRALRTATRMRQPTLLSQPQQRPVSAPTPAEQQQQSRRAPRLSRVHLAALSAVGALLGSVCAYWLHRQ